MCHDKNQKDKEDVLDINEGDEINVSDFIEVQSSDITVTAQREDGEEQNIIFQREIPSDAIAQQVSDVLSIPENVSYSFQKLIFEKVEEIKKKPTKFKLNGPSLYKLFQWPPDFNILSLEVKTGEKIIHRKTTIKMQLPKNEIQ